MARFRLNCGACALVSTLTACGLGVFSDPDGNARELTPAQVEAAPETRWSLDADPSYLHVLTYNVAGLPQGLSSGNPERNIPLISSLLNPYDLVLVQEDFAFHAALISQVDHPFQSVPDSRGRSLGDGLNVLSRIPFGVQARDPWNDCNGTINDGADCLTPKGFWYSRLELTDGLYLDLYNVHMDAGHAGGDVRARARNFAELARGIRSRSAGVAVIVAGDFNERYRDAGEQMESFLAETGLMDAWVEFVHQGALPGPAELASACGTDPNDIGCERIDKILFRSSAWLSLSLVDHAVEGETFVDASYRQLSDHRPVSAMFTVKQNPYSQAQMASP